MTNFPLFIVLSVLITAFLFSYGSFLIVILSLLIKWLKSLGHSSSSSQPRIFLSFRGIDTRENIASLMYVALDGAGFDVFMDDQSIRTGHDIDLVIREAINNSMGAVIIFSRNFASSEWCLEELVLILDRKRELGSGYVLQSIYMDDVDPDHIRAGRGSYSDAIAEHKRRYSYWNSNWKKIRKWQKKVKSWNSALKEVVIYKGWILRGKWTKFIDEVVKDIHQEFTTLGIFVNKKNEMVVLRNSTLIISFFIFLHYLGDFGE